MNLPNIEEIVARALTALPAAVAIIVGALVVRFILNRGLHLLADKTRLTRTDVAPVRRVGGWLLFGLTVVLLLGVFGFDLGGLWTMLSTVLAMVAIGFVAVWSVLSNASCTLIILIFRPFNVGDDLEFVGDEVRGRVVDLNFLYTTLQGTDGALLQIPNNLFFQKVLKRWKGEGRVSLTEQLGRDTPSQA